MIASGHKSAILDMLDVLQSQPSVGSHVYVPPTLPGALPVGEQVLASELAETKRKLRYAEDLAERMTLQSKETRLSLETLRNHAQSLSNSTSSLQLELQQRSAELSSLASSYQALQQLSADQQVAIDSGNRVLFETRTELAELRARAAIEDGERRNAFQQTASATHELSSLRKQLENSETSRTAAERRRGELELEVDNANRLASQRAEAVKTLEADLSREKIEVSSRLQLSLDTMRAELHEARLQLQIQRAEVNRLTDVAASAESRGAAAAKDRDVLVHEHLREIKAIEAAKAASDREASAAKASANAAQSALTDAQAGLQAARQQLAEASDTIRRLQSQVIAIETSNMQHLEDFKALTAHADKVEVESKAAKARSAQALTLLQRQLAGVRVQAQAQRDRLIELQHKAQTACSKAASCPAAQSPF
jgi:putative ABC transport system permease protein